jgi:ankyrin repeat protein
MPTLTTLVTFLLLCLVPACSGGVDIEPGSALPYDVVAKGGVDKVAAYLDSGASIEAPIEEVRATPLTVAIGNRRWATVNLLLERGADVNNQAKDGTNALHGAVFWNNMKLGRRLIEMGADVNQQMNRGDYVLGEAARNGYDDWIEFLLEKGADVNAVDKRGRTALHVACDQKGKESTIRLLLERGAKVDVTGPQNISALHVAAKAGHVEYVRILLDAGADVNRASAHYLETPLMLAVQARKTEAARLLLSKGADPAAADDDGRTALDRARKVDVPELISALEAVTPGK